MSFDSNELLLTESTNESTAKTLGGKLFERVHNAFSSSVLLSEKDRVQRGQHADNMAEVVGDTVAMLPVMKWGTAGAVRAGILLNTNDGLLNAGGNFAKNFAEGAVLNKVASTVFGEGKLSAAVEKQLGKGLTAEATRFAIGGFGIGGVKSAFRSETYFNQDGKFDPLHASLETVKSASIGAVLAIPGGFIGSRIAKGGLALNSKGLISENTALGIAGVGSGYFSGAAVGGMQALAIGADWKTTASMMNESGLIGAATGGLTISALKHFQQFKEHKSNTDTSGRVLLGKAYAANESIEDGFTPQLRHADDAPIDAARLESLKFLGARDRGDDSLATKLQDIGTFKREEIIVHVPKPNAEAIAKNSAEFSTFVNDGLVEKTVPSRTWNIRGVPVSMSETYARALDEVVQLRMHAAKEHSSNPIERSLALSSKEQLKVNPFKDKAHAVDFLHLIEELPDRSLVKRILIREDNNPTDAWISKTYKPDFKAAATASENGVLSFYNQNRGYDLGQYMRHEWGHLLMWAATPEQYTFARAAELEKDDYQSKKAYYITEYAKKDHDENWAEHMRGLLHPDPKVFLEVAHQAPVRSMIMGTALVKSLFEAGHQNGSTIRSGIANRVAYLQNEIMPLAKNDLSYHLGITKGTRGMLSAELLGKYANEKELSLLSQTAKHDTDPLLAKAAFDAAFRNINEKGAVSSQYNRQQLQDTSANKIRFLMDQLSPGSQSKDTALSYLQRVSQDRFAWYNNLFSLSSRADLNRVIGLLDTAGDGPSQKLAFNHALEMIGKNPDDRVNLALRALEKHPLLTEDAARILATEAQPRTLGFLQDLQGHYNGRVVDFANQGVNKIQNENILTLSSKGLNSDDMQVRMDTALQLAQTRDMRAANPLIDGLLRATDPMEQNAFLRAMKTYITPGILKHQIRTRMSSTDAQETATLRRALQSPISYQPKENTSNGI